MAALVLPRIIRSEFLKYQKISFCLQPLQNQSKAFGQTRNICILSKSPVYKSNQILLRFASTSPNIPLASKDLGPIPEPPVPIPDGEWLSTISSTIKTTTFNGEPSFESIGLGGWSPVGIVQNCMEYLHISCDLPWWTTIVIGTVCVRLLLFPLVIISQRNAAKLNNNLPQLQLLQLKMSEARQSGNQLESAKYGVEMMNFMKEKGCNPLKNLLVPLAQAPLFISFFVGLRQMANCPVESLATGGLWWFTDLTVPDQYYLLPIITSTTLWLTIELGSDSAKLDASNMQMMKYVFRALPIVIFPFTINFSGAILCYWVSTNFISLLQVGFLKIPTVRQFFKIEPLIPIDKASLPIKNKGFIKGIKESYTNMQITQELDDRHRYDEMQFQRAGHGPIQKTFRFDPTKVKIYPPIEAKKK